MSVDSIVNQITDNLTGDGSVDYIQLTENMYFIKHIVEPLLGLMAAIVVIGIPIIVALELTYINIPTFQYGANKIIDNVGNKAVKVTFGLVLHDAKKACLLVATTQRERTVNTIYFRIKVKAIILGFVALAFQLGAGSSIISFIMSIADSIIQGINSTL